MTRFITNVFLQAKSEVVYLMEQLDTDKSKDLSENEIMKEPELFLKSQVSFFGEMYKDADLRKKIFMLEEKK